MNVGRRNAIVTGASRGIGRAIAIALGGAGYNVTVNYHRNLDAANECARLLAETGAKAHIVQADVSQKSDRQRLVDETTERFGEISLLVNNAGVAPRRRDDLLESREDEFDHVVGVNLKGPYFLTQLVARRMLAEAKKPYPGDMRAIVNVNSISAYAATVARGEYCVAKAGLAMATKLFADRLAENGINVYEIRPGIIQSDMTSAVKTKYDKLILQEGITPIRRWGQPDDVAKAVVAIAEGKFPFSTGEVINVDGGFHLRRL